MDIDIANVAQHPNTRHPVLKQVAILVGGRGTRLGAQTDATPKPLLQVAGKPFLEHLIHEVTRYGVFTDIVLLAGYRGADVAARYHGQYRRGARIRVVVEPVLAGTGGALLNAREVLDEHFLLLNGDSFFDCNFLDLCGPMRFGTLATIALLSDHCEDRYGRVALADHHVIAFSPPGQGNRGPINAGIYAFDRKALDLLPPPPCSLEQDLLPRLARQGSLAAKVYDGFFIDIGIPNDLARADRELAARLRRPAVFFDRDGVLNRDNHYVHRPDQFVWIDSAKQAIKACNDRGAFVFVVTNQAGVGRGLYGEAEVEVLHAWMNRELAAVGAHVDAFEYCPHHPQATSESYRRSCRRRKPEPGMILDLANDWSVDLERSFMIGDKNSDVDAANAAGIEGVLFSGGDLLKFLAPQLDKRMGELLHLRPRAR